jgi:hypothetical protein
MVVDAPPEVRPGKPAREPLDPETIAWMHRAETDADGRFALPEVPVGKLRVVVVAGGYERLEQWAELEPGGGELELHLEPEGEGTYRTVVETKRRETGLEVPPTHTLDPRRARRYPGSGGDPLLAALNLPGTVRSPGGFGLLAFRGGDPSEVGVYVDGHPVPRAFHVIPIASVLSPPMIADLEISPGNFAANYGGFGGGLVRLDSRPGRRDGIHGESHLDLFDVGGTIEGSVGKGSIHVGVRRSHVGDVLRLVPLPQLTAPNFWDYLARFDYPLKGGHAISVRGLGAGDRLLLSNFFDFRAGFHRFDFEHTYKKGEWQVLFSPSLRLDSNSLVHDEDHYTRRNAQVYSLRLASRWQPLDFVALDFGTDVVVERWRRREQGKLSYDPGGFYYEEPLSDSEGTQLRFGAWLATPLRLRDWSLIPAVRLNVFDYGLEPQLRVDPRLSLRGPLSAAVRLLAAFGMYAIPVVGAYEDGVDGYLNQGGEFADGVADLPEYLLTYFDPNIDGEVNNRFVSSTQVLHASLGFEAALPWRLDLRAIAFWRSAPGVDFTPKPYVPGQPVPNNPDSLESYGSRRAMGFELLLGRPIAPDFVEGWLGYTLMWARVEDESEGWLPAVFDQRHNFVALLSFALPRNFRFGLRFRLSSGNPMTPVTGREVVPVDASTTIIRPLRGVRGSEYQPLFHQLDLRLDKGWVLDRVRVGAYLDIQNVYNRWYPEFWIYSTDWSARQQAIGLPIYPSVGVQVEY